MIKAVLFDMDGVLVDSREANRKFKIELFKRAGYGDIDLEHIEGFHKPMQTVITEALASKGVTDKTEIDRVFGLMFDSAVREVQDFKFPKDLESTLEELGKRFDLGIVTSRIRFGIDEIFKLRPIEKYFDVVISFDDCLNHKPHPEPLQKALQKLKLSPAEAIYIGDSDTDIIAASAIDMPSIHLSEAKHELTHHQVFDFDEIVNAIKLIENNYAYSNS